MKSFFDKLGKASLEKIHLRILIFLFYLCLSNSSTGQNLTFLPAAKGQVINHTYYSLSYIEAHEQAEWVAYYLSPEMLYKVYDRKNSFSIDVKVATGSATYKDYTSSPMYDAGHLLPCRQMQFDCEAMLQTFYMSNMSPQHKDLNRGKWATLERLERNMAWENKGLYVISGPILTHTIGYIGVENSISIPQYFYKVFLSENADDIKAIALLLPNHKISNETPMEDFLISIDSLEVLTQIDFFPELEDELEQKLEEKVISEGWVFNTGKSKFSYQNAPQKCNGSHQQQSSIVQSVNINTASLEELDALPGIGPVKAQAIIDARPYHSIKEIVKAKGIGNATFLKLEGMIVI